ncbi:DMT family transporter [Geobacter grbiciae]|uniref:DMT family transporter n=1 Tax=Geobacter grbiciae TaxID=155042 RepID=UPI001C01544E|nr:DMT family transporter [Geobacter grbiciae]MBT1074025.1 EamA family transporter [Geobacter grbiciae]
MYSGQFLAVISAVLFGISPVLCKLVIGEMSPALLAGLLYLGSGIGLHILLLFQGKKSIEEVKRLSPKKRLALLGSILSGGIVAPLFLAYGIKLGTASEVSLLLNFETVATTLIAWFVFREHVGLGVWGGKALILLGSVFVILKNDGALAFSSAGLLVLLACAFWGIDNNLTRDIEELPATVLASIKGFGAGAFNTLLALALSTGTATVPQVAGSLLIGAMSYGMSLVLFVEALRRIGSARTSTLFAIGPFIGTFLSVLILGERPPATYWVAASLMLAGIALLQREMHGHPHTHEELSHSHKHLHDEHHQHEHAEGEGTEPHDHPHLHEPLTHSHVHWPDIHHRHSH